MNSYELLGLVSIVWLWLCLLYLANRWPSNKSMTFSSIAAQNNAGVRYYLVTFSTHLFLFYVFVIKWLVPTYGLPSAFTVLMGLALLGEFTALLVPTTGGRKTLVHNISSYIMLVLLVPLSLIIAVTQSFSIVVRIAATLAVICMMIIGAIFVTQKSAKNSQLIYQVIYGGSFHLVILLAIFIK